MHFSSFYAALALLLLSTINLASPIPANNGNVSGSLVPTQVAIAPTIHYTASKTLLSPTQAISKRSDAGLQQVKKTVVTSDSRGTSFVQVLVDKLPSATPARVGASQWTPLSSQGGTRAFSVSDAGTVFNVVFRTK
ncbi:hypothetical protein DL96DRAFT_1684862 [Flagelloscypha sp. PMI_526]|nr:hypothetical protein DL96DRAFT_1684862 [Flagelloscypha sp. PMI_526]